MTQTAAEQPGAVYKNPAAKHHDVLNGDIYAAHTLGRAYEATGHIIYIQKAEEIVHHVANRFGAHEAGWWPYTENWDGTAGIGNSVSYQGTIIAFAHPLLPLLPPPLAERWSDIEETAVLTMLKAMDGEPNEANEAPWWCRDWNNAWEIYLAFWRKKAIGEARTRLTTRLIDVERQLNQQGAATFIPKVKHNDPERTPVTTTFRKAATFAGIVSYMILDGREMS